MADLIPHLILPSSQETHHSSPETVQDAIHNQDPPPTPDHQPATATPAPTSTTKPAQPDTTIAALQAAGLSVQDVNSYLNDPSNATLLASTPKRKGTASNLPTTTPFGTNLPTTLPTPQPIQLGNPKSSHHITLLNHLAQERGLRPVFEFAEPVPMRFSVVLRVGEMVVRLHGDDEGEGQGDMTFGSKREAKEAVAARGVEVLKEMPVPGAGYAGTGAGAGAGAGAEENWVGKLAEFHTTTTTTPTTPTAAATSGPIYTDYALGTNYACECTIPLRPDTPFGARTRPFPNKKAAKTNAAREAVLWLVERGDMLRTAEGAYVVNGIGSGRKKGKGKGRSGGAGFMAGLVAGSEGTGEGTGNGDGDGEGGVGVGVGGAAGVDGKEVSFAARVNELCPILGLSAPEYRLTASPQAPTMYSGAAHFVKDPLVNDSAPVGEVRLVFGRRNAKEACAERVLGFLVGMVRERRGGRGDGGGGGGGLGSG